MKISNLFNRTQAYNSEKAGDAQRSQEKNLPAPAALQQGKEGEDKISISPRARQFQQISKVVAEDASTRGARVQAIKAQVENGSYAISNDDVAKAIVSFVRDNTV